MRQGQQPQKLQMVSASCGRYVGGWRWCRKAVESDLGLKERLESGEQRSKGRCRQDEGGAWRWRCRRYAWWRRWREVESAGRADARAGRFCEGERMKREGRKWRAGGDEAVVRRPLGPFFSSRTEAGAGMRERGGGRGGANTGGGGEAHGKGGRRRQRAGGWQSDRARAKKQRRERAAAVGQGRGLKGGREHSRPPHTRLLLLLLLLLHAASGAAEGGEPKCGAQHYGRQMQENECCKGTEGRSDARNGQEVPGAAGLTVDSGDGGEGEGRGVCVGAADEEGEKEACGAGHASHHPGAEADV